MHCLRRSLALQRMLNRRGIPTTLRFGVRQEATELKAHAWLECDGRPICEMEDIEIHYPPLLAREVFVGRHD